jgi:hypothetical protein
MGTELGPRKPTHDLAGVHPMPHASFEAVKSLRSTSSCKNNSLAGLTKMVAGSRNHLTENAVFKRVARPRNHY